MANLGQVFDAHSVEPNTPAELIPAGKYAMQVVNSEMRDTKSGTGQYLWCELSIMDGPFAGRRVFDRLNLVNPNEKAVEIAQRTLSAMCRATGQMSVSDSEQLHHRTMVVTVKVKPADGQYGASNEIGGYAPPDGAMPTTAPRPATAPMQHKVHPAVSPAAVTAATPPWRRTA